MPQDPPETPRDWTTQPTESDGRITVPDDRQSADGPERSANDQERASDRTVSSREQPSDSDQPPGTTGEQRRSPLVDPSPEQRSSTLKWTAIALLVGASAGIAVTVLGSLSVWLVELLVGPVSLLGVPPIALPLAQLAILLGAPLVAGVVAARRGSGTVKESALLGGGAGVLGMVPTAALSVLFVPFVVANPFYGSPGLSVVVLSVLLTVLVVLAVGGLLGAVAGLAVSMLRSRHNGGG